MTGSAHRARSAYFNQAAMKEKEQDGVPRRPALLLDANSFGKCGAQKRQPNPALNWKLCVVALREQPAPRQGTLL